MQQKILHLEEVRDEILNDLEKTAQYISELTSIETAFVKEMLIRNNQKIFDTLILSL